MHWSDGAPGEPERPRGPGARSIVTSSTLIVVREVSRLAVSPVWNVSYRSMVGMPAGAIVEPVASMSRAPST